MEDSSLEQWYSEDGRCPIKRLTEHALKRNPDLFKERKLSQSPENVYRRGWNEQNRIRLAMSSRMYYSLYKAKGNTHWEEYVSYTTEELKQHLESLFRDGMSWDNYGEWEIDHIIPVSAFNYNSPSDISFKHCWALQNLRPLWKPENRAKGKRIDRPKQVKMI